MNYRNSYKNRLKQNLLILLVGVFPVIFTSCEKEVILDLSDMEGEYLIVEGNIDDQSPEQWIRLTGSSSYYDVTTGLPVSNASVTVTDGTTDYVFTESSVDTLRGYYYNDKIGNEFSGGTYHLTIEHEGEIYTAQSEFRPVPVIDSITVGINFFSDIGLTEDKLYDIYIHFDNRPGKGDYYLADFFINGRLQTARPTQKTIFSDEDLEEYVSRSVKTVNGNDLENGDIFSVELRSISSDKYDFYFIFLFQTNLSGNPFAGAPPANIPTNLSEGARGFFQVSSVSSAQGEFRF